MEKATLGMAHCRYTSTVNLSHQKGKIERGIIDLQQICHSKYFCPEKEKNCNSCLVNYYIENLKALKSGSTTKEELKLKFKEDYARI